MGASVHFTGLRDPLRDMRSRFGLWGYDTWLFVASTSCYVVLVKCMCRQHKHVGRCNPCMRGGLFFCNEGNTRPHEPSPGGGLFLLL